MRDRRRWRSIVAAALLALGLAASRSDAFVENTETEGEVQTNLNGAWLLVTHIEFTKPTATPEPGATPAPTPQQSPAAAAASVRHFNVVNLLKIVHTPKAQADVRRAEAKKKQQASIDKAKQILAEEAKKSVPVQTETGEIEGEAKVLVPAIPMRQQPAEGDDIDVFLLDVALPKGIQESVDKAQKAEARWIPTEKDLALLKSSWSTLPPSGRDEFSKIDWKVTASDKYDDNLKIDPTTKDAKFTISGNEEMVPKPNVPKTNVVVYGIEQVNGEVLSGKHTRAMMASAPFPLPIEMKGSFKMYRVGELPKVSASKPTAAKPTAGKKKAAAKP